MYVCIQNKTHYNHNPNKIKLKKDIDEKIQ